MVVNVSHNFLNICFFKVWIINQPNPIFCCLPQTFNIFTFNICVSNGFYYVIANRAAWGFIYSHFEEKFIMNCSSMKRFKVIKLLIDWRRYFLNVFKTTGNSVKGNIFIKMFCPIFLNLFYNVITRFNCTKVNILITFRINIKNIQNVRELWCLFVQNKIMLFQDILYFSLNSYVKLEITILLNNVLYYLYWKYFTIFSY